VCGDDAGVVLVLDSKTGEELRRLEHPVSIAGLSFRRQGRLLAVRTSDIQGGNELHVFVWDASTGELLARLRHEDRVHHVEWSPDGTLLATASQDKRTRVFGAPEFHELTRHAFAEICAHVTFTGDGSRLFSCSYDGSLRVSRARAADLIALAQARLPRRLTPDEWHQYLGEEPLPST
jgi:WD40 repeat protein